MLDDHPLPNALEVERATLVIVDLARTLLELQMLDAIANRLDPGVHHLPQVVVQEHVRERLVGVPGRDEDPQLLEAIFAGLVDIAD
eukprot:6786566-Lingulodinium_polyedra.AAC.1